MVLLRLSREATDDVSSDRHIGHLAEQFLRDLIKLLHGILSIHFREDGIRAGLHWDVKEGIAARVAEETDDGVEVLQHVRRVGHPHAEHAAVRQRLEQRLHELRHRRADVSPVRPRVFRREPHLHHALRERRAHPRGQRRRRIRPQPPACVDSLAVSARAQAARVARDDLHQPVLPNLRQLELRPLRLAEQAHRVPLERLPHDLHHPADLLHADDRQPRDELEVRLRLRDAAGHDDRLVRRLRPAHVRGQVLLRRVLHRA
mmetsp:Transcript_15507/g.32806  ORF Transcript_15507/g.32806 Transcript_15507/m.32806 type:complete len:260 (+) Transcript_15507:207-986(+)